VVLFWVGVSYTILNKEEGPMIWVKIAGYIKLFYCILALILLGIAVVVVFGCAIAAIFSL